MTKNVKNNLKKISWWLGAGLLGAAVFGLYVRQRYMTDAPPTHYADAVDHFKYGSYGSEQTGLPYPIWKVLPAVCPDFLPGGYAGLGLYTEPGHDLPVGVSLRKYGVVRVGLNCAACHAGVRDEGGKQILIPGMPNPRFDSQGYSAFIQKCVLSSRFTPDAVFAAIDQQKVEFSWLDRIVYRHFVFKKIHELALQADKDLSWMKTRPVQGPGRTDTANLFRMQLGQNPGGDNLPGTVDYPSLWNQGLRAKHGGGQHWDGDNDSFRERNYTSALASGATEESMDQAAVDRVSDWVQDLPPPRYPYPVDASKAARGKELWLRERCNTCHDFDSANAGQLTLLPEIGTDPGRVLAFTQQTADAFKKLGVGKPWHITHYRKTHGYLNVWTDGVWARSPYLHNGSVPNLYELLLPPDQRSKVFVRGCAKFDPVKVGWQCESGFSFDTSLPGNRNSGHLYGTTLTEPERWDLVEFMKTL